MKLKDLITGDLVQLRNGQIKIVIGDILVGISDGNFANYIKLSDYSDDLYFINTFLRKKVKIVKEDER